MITALKGPRSKPKTKNEINLVIKFVFQSWIGRRKEFF